MTTLAIINMRQSPLHPHNLNDFAVAPTMQTTERSHYWFIERKSVRGNKWIFVRDFIGTKREVAALYVKYFQHQSPACRIRHQMSY